MNNSATTFPAVCGRGAKQLRKIRLLLNIAGTPPPPPQLLPVLLSSSPLQPDRFHSPPPTRDVKTQLFMSIGFLCTGIEIVLQNCIPDLHGFREKVK